MTIAPRLIMKAQKNPRRAPSFMIVILMGPTGIDTTKPLITPARPAVKSPSKYSMPSYSSSDSSSSSISRRISREMRGRTKPYTR